MQLIIGRWVQHQHRKNPRLPDLSPRQIRDIVDQARSEQATPLTREGALEWTGYPLKEGRGHEFYAVDGSWVVEVRPFKNGKIVAAILQGSKPA